MYRSMPTRRTAVERRAVRLRRVRVLARMRSWDAIVNIGLGCIVGSMLILTLIVVTCSPNDEALHAERKRVDFYQGLLAESRHTFHENHETTMRCLEREASLWKSMRIGRPAGLYYQAPDGQTYWVKVK